MIQLKRGAIGLRALSAFLFAVAACSSDGGQGTPEPQGGADGGDGAAGSQCDPADDPATGFLPCDVQAVLKAKCQRCHNTPDVLAVCEETNGCLPGPFPLLTWADTRKELSTGPVYEYMGKVVKAGIMPYPAEGLVPPVQSLTEAEKATIIEWSESCGPSANAACAD